MKRRIIFASFLAVMFVVSCSWHNPGSTVDSKSDTSIRLLPRSNTFDLAKVPQGVVGFTALVKNERPTAITIAHPSICFPTDYKQGEARHIEDSHGKSEILLKITKPNGVDVILRDGYLGYFDPGNVPLIEIPANESGIFDLGWFFQNARGKWEHNDEAAKVFLMRGTYKIRILFRNAFTKAVLYDKDTKEVKFIDVWTGEMESPEATIEVK
jgi:hypothetical protein